MTDATKKTDSWDVAQIAERAVLVYLGTGAWTASKKDIDLTKAAVSEANAAGEALKVSKVLLPGATELVDIRKLVTEFRTFHYSKTTAFGRDGWALLPSKTLGEYKSTFLDFHQRWEDAVKKFIDNYDSLRARASQEVIGLGKAFKETDYPSKEEVQSRFKFTTDVRRIRESHNDLIGVSDELRQDIMREADQRVRAGLETSVASVAERISETVGNVVDVLTREGKKSPKIYDSLIENVRALAAELPALNVTGDKTFNAIADKMLNDLGAVKVDDLKGKSEGAVKARKETADTATEILDTMSSIF